MKTGNGLILVENPLCGNDSVANALGIKDSMTKWVVPADGRKIIGKEKWESSTKIVLVRDPLTRFITACTLALNSTKEQLIEHGAGEEIATLISTYEGKDSEFANFILDNGEFVPSATSLPTYFLSQIIWLSCKFDLVLASHNIAEFFNVEGKVSVRKSNIIQRNPKLPRQATANEEARMKFRGIFEKDLKLFERLLVWSPNTDRVRLVQGYCATCEAKRGKEFSPVDLTDFVEEREPKKVKKKATRQRKSSSQ